MALNCPNCGASIPALDINIHEMAAVCAACGHVFYFKGELPTRKAKPRKVKHPQQVRIKENDEQLDLSFGSVNWKQPNPLLIMLSIFAVVFSLVYVAGINDPTVETEGLFFLTLLVSSLWYVVATMLALRTRISMGTDALIRSIRSPFLLSLSLDEKTLQWDDISQVFCEETEQSKQAESLDRYYHVYLLFADGRRSVFLRSIPQDYAFYVAQLIEERLQPGEDAVILTGNEFEDDSEQSEDNPQQLSELLAQADESENARQQL
jgi:hypothetical protein